MAISYGNRKIFFKSGPRIYRRQIHSSVRSLRTVRTVRRICLLFRR